MAKRKRSSESPSLAPSSSPEPAGRTLKHLKRSCDSRLVSAKKSLITALRLGAGFERQKHSRRKKTAQSKSDTKAITRLDAEYVVLKSLDLEKVADQHLRKTVGKVKSLREHEALQDYAAGVKKGSTEPAMLNVLARLYSVAAVKKVVDEVVDELKEIVGAGEGAATTHNGHTKGVKTPKKAKVNGEREEDMPDVSDEEDDAFAAFSARIAAPSSGEEDSDDSISDDERPPSIGDSESEHDPDDDLEGQGESEEEDSFEGFGSEDKDDHIGQQIAPPSDLSESDSEPSSSDEPSTPSTKAKSKALIEVKPTSSAFLPTLSNAYLPGSESEASDLDEPPRKNRRGQRARQKIAELKFGAKAKHLEKQERNKGWDPKRGAVSNDRRSKPTGRGPQMSGENALPLGKKKSEGVKRDDKGELHPSWQAAKLAKEKKQIKIDVRVPQGLGKKVIFD